MLKIHIRFTICNMELVGKTNLYARHFTAHFALAHNLNNPAHTSGKGFENSL